MSETYWLRPLHTDSPFDNALLCLPHAGTGPRFFEPLADALAAEDVNVWAACLPGREHRFTEPPEPDLNTVIRQLADAVTASPPRQWHLLGHCSGAILAYELAHELSQRGAPPGLVCVSAQTVPEAPAPTPVHRLPFPQLVEHLRTLGGTAPEVLECTDLMRVLEPMIRADFRMVETYKHPTGRPRLGIPIMALGGADDLVVDAQTLEGWGRFTSAEFTAQLVHGGHFFMEGNPTDVAATLSVAIDTIQQHSHTGTVS